MEPYTIWLKLYYVPAKNHNIRLVVRNSYHVRSRDRDFCRGGFANNTCEQSPISKTRPGRDIMVNRADMISEGVFGGVKFSLPT